MKARFTFLMIFVLLMSTVFGQNKKSINDYLTALPKDLKLDKSVQQKYIMITEYDDFDCFGNFQNKKKISGEYTTGLDNGFVKWNNVVISKWNKAAKEYFEGEKQSVMENFTYVPSEKMLNPAAFTNFPPNSSQLQNLVWDMMGFETFAWEYFDSLKLNKEFVAQSANTEIDLAGSGTFENKDIRLNWIGITKMNSEICVIIEYTAMNNPLKIKNDFIDIKGRSHYWGYIYVSLEDKQIEYAMLNEDVIMEIKFPNQDKTQRANTIRKITLNKVL